jgi:hypothetical protein
MRTFTQRRYSVYIAFLRFFSKRLKQYGFLCPLIGGGSYENKFFTQVRNTTGRCVTDSQGFPGAGGRKKPRVSEKQSQNRTFWDCHAVRFIPAFFGGMFNRGGVAGDFGIQLRGSGILRL